MLGSLLSVFVVGFAVGGLARWALPGPDPMPVWLTVLFGLCGSLIGALVAAAFIATDTPSKTDYFIVTIAEIAATILLLIAYRRYVQKRPLTGPAAHEPPTRGWGLRRRPGPGVRPHAARPAVRPPKREVLAKLDELHEQGVLSEDEYVAKRREVIAWEK